MEFTCEDKGWFSICLFFIFMSILICAVGGLGILTIFLLGGWNRYTESDGFIVICGALIVGFLDLAILVMFIAVSYVIINIIRGIGRKILSIYRLRYEVIPETAQL